MNYRIRMTKVFVLLAIAVFGVSCAKTAQSPTEAYKMLFAAVKAKNTEQIKSLMTKNTLGLAQFNADRQKISLEKSLENGLVAPTMADQITEIRDERVKGNFGAVEVRNEKENRWEDLPFIYEDGGWKLAVGDLFQGKFESPGKSKGDIEREESNTGMPPVNAVSGFPTLTGNSNSMTMPANSNGNKSANAPVDKKDKSVEVPKEEKPKK